MREIMPLELAGKEIHKGSDWKHGTYEVPGPCAWVVCISIRIILPICTNCAMYDSRNSIVLTAEGFQKLLKKGKKVGFNL